MTALQSVRSTEGPILVSASEKRRARAASPLELTTGDGAAAVLVGEGEPIAHYIGGHTEAVDFVDHFRGKVRPLITTGKNGGSAMRVI
ncbi:MAG: hypothetical protein CM1200mP18_22850 [Gammaproteobacteria bacterium]|nr:MAG: hypothetical protein CM1200mP18_22850 [Gammaproteobacteria bacterium]